MSSGREENGESRTTAAIFVAGGGAFEEEGAEEVEVEVEEVEEVDFDEEEAKATASLASADAASKAATAPIDLPQIAILHFGPRSCTKAATRSARSSASRYPRVTCPPSERPEPEKSSAATAIPAGSSRPSTSSASLLEPELQWA